MWERKLSGQKRPWLNISHAARCCFHLLRHYYFVNLNPRNTWKYWAYSFVHWFFIFWNRVRSIVHRLIFFWLVPQPSRFLTRGFWAETWDCNPALTCTLNWNNVVAETGRDEKDVVFRFLMKFWSYNYFFWTHAEHFCFHPLCPPFFWFSTYPRHTGFNLLYLDFAIFEIGVRSGFHFFLFFLLIPWTCKLLKLVFWWKPRAAV